MTSNTRDIAVAMRHEVLPHDAKRYGVVIGIDQYRDERLNLRCARADAEAIRNLMIDPECGLFDEDHVTLLLDDAATREQIWRTLAGLRRKTHAHDSVWIFYAGHGAPEGDDFYWVPHDGDVDDLYSTGLSRHDLNRVLDEIHAERIVAFMDCCHAAAMACQKNKTREIITAEKALAAYRGKGRLIFAASDGREKSVEVADQGRGAFSYFLEQGLRGEADVTRAGVVTADGLWLYLKDKVTTAAQAAGNPQSPVRIGEETHDFALSLNPLEFGRRKRIAEAIKSMVGVGSDQLTTEEGRVCLDLLRRGARTDAERDLTDEFDALVEGGLRTSTLRRLISQAKESVPHGNPERPPSGNASVEMQYQGAHAPDSATTQTGERVRLGEPALGEQLDGPATVPQRDACSIEPEEALRLIDTWSIENPEYLNPLSAHAEMTDCRQFGVYVGTITSLVEIRKSSTVREPFGGDPTTDPRLADPATVANVYLEPPSSFTAKTASWQSPEPVRVMTCDGCGGKGQVRCSKCHGTGQWICGKCQGIGHVMCETCSGTGKDTLQHNGYGVPINDGRFKTNKECITCHGAKVMPCVACKGQPKRTCPACGGQKTEPCKKCASSGRLAEFDRLESEFAVNVDSGVIIAGGVLPIASESIDTVQARPVLTWVTEKKQLPEKLDELPSQIAEKVRQRWASVVAKSKGSVHRMRLELGHIPCTVCSMKHGAVTFDMHILGDENKVFPTAGVPKDVAYLLRQRVDSLRKSKLDCEENFAAAKAVLLACAAGFVLCLSSSVFGIFKWVAAPNSPWSLLAVFSVLGVIALLVLAGVGLFSRKGLVALRAKSRRLSNELAQLRESDTDSSPLPATNDRIEFVRELKSRVSGKIDQIKEVRGKFGLSLKEAKDLLESVE